MLQVQPFQDTDRTFRHSFLSGKFQFVTVNICGYLLSTDNELTLWRMENLKQLVLLSFEIAIISRESRPRGSCEKEENFYGEKPFLNQVSGQTLPLQALWFICIVNVCKLSFFIFSFFFTPHVFSMLPNVWRSHNGVGFQYFIRFYWPL